MACSFCLSPRKHPGKQLCERTTGFEPATSTLARWCSSQLSYVRKTRQSRLSVRDTGIEPVTSSVSGKRATAAPIALDTSSLPEETPMQSRERTTGFEPATSTLARWCSSQLSYVRKNTVVRQKRLTVVRDTGIEPVTSSVSGKRATAAPIAPKGLASPPWRWGRDSNPRIRLCRPLPRLSATPP